MDYKNFYFVKDREDLAYLPFEMKCSKRLELIKEFLKKSKNCKYENISEVHDRFVAKRFVEYNKYSIFSHIIFGFMIYNFIFSGKYNLGIIKNSKNSLTTFLRFSFSMILSIFLHFRSMNFIVYDPYLYDIALKYM